MRDAGFRGPLFIVGSFRSGTSLLATLLNEHPRIAIPVTETNFLTNLVRAFGDPPRLDEEGRLDQFYVRFCDTLFFDWRRRQGVVMSKRDLSERADLNSWASIFEAILKFYAPKNLTTDMIWGDRSPGHLTAIKLLKSVCPAAKFLHIIRDPRDVCLSAKKNWGKSLYRSASLWQQRVAAGRRAGATLAEDYHEVAFESLLEDPRATLKAVCDHLQVDFTDAMLNISVAYTSNGDARGAREIVRHNKGKYRSQLPVRTIRRIEEIVYPTATEAGYHLDYALGFRPLGSVGRNLLLCHDGAMVVKRYARHRGMRWAASYLARKGAQVIRGHI